MTSLVSRQFTLAVLLALFALTSRSAAAETSPALERGTRWLLDQQAADGGWHSTTYGSMRDGTGTTALVLHALTHMPEPWQRAHRTQIERGIRFLLADLDDQGYLAGPRQSADHPLYSTALLVAALDRAGIDQWPTERRRMQDYLNAVQRREPIDSPLRGGWPLVGGAPSEAQSESNVNVSVTRFALEALGENLNDHRDSREAAKEFLERCQNPTDGGFHFIPLPDEPLNKAGESPTGQPRSYGTATADGLVALAACGTRRDDPLVLAALQWLESHDSLAEVPGFEKAAGVEAAAGKALEFYYFAALARVIELFPDAAIASRAKPLAVRITELQRSDGSWSNPATMMREDDPLIATAHAVSALATLQKAAEKQP